RVATTLAAEDEDETRLVYVLTDLRRSEWENASQIEQQFQLLNKSNADVRVIDCAAQQQPNLAITQLAPNEGTRSPGVPLFVTASVKNFGPGVAANVELTVTSYAYENYDPLRHGDDVAAVKPQSLDQRTETIPSIAVGETVSRRVQVRFPYAGQHVVEARLADDALAADNLRYSVVDFPAGEPVLIVDGHAVDGIPDQRNAYFLAAVFQPDVRGAGGDASTGVRTGVIPTIEPPARLRDITMEELQSYRAVYLLDVPQLDTAAIRNLEQYVQAGGGLAFFLGDSVLPSRYDEELFADGKGLLPMPIGERELLLHGELDDADDRAPDFETVDHPVLSIFNTGDARFRRAVLIGTYFTAADGWTPSDSTKVLATLRDEARTPWVVERQYGQGRVMLFNTTVAPLWNNWARGDGGGPSFVVTMLQLHAYLAAPLRVNESEVVGARIARRFDAKEHSQEVKLVVPAITPLGRKPIVEKAAPGDSAGAEAGRLWQAAIDADQAEENSLRSTDRQGIYEIWTAKNTGELSPKRFALNIDPRESDLARVAPQQLVGDLQAKFRIEGTNDSGFDASTSGASDVSDWILYALIALLIGEQMLAYSAGYHRARGAAA
ncbi:MAG: hypothetical protein KDA41_15310, partial [Planctomycetales bacterium]|nr:hypothetical protein [Planctomycetales bacterium]